MYMRKPHGLDKHFSEHGCNAKLAIMSAEEACIGAGRKVEVARNSKVWRGHWTTPSPDAV
jgi:hypothetical protein